jgi:hypothetical protein
MESLTPGIGLLVWTVVTFMAFAGIGVGIGLYVYSKKKKQKETSLHQLK